MNQKKVKRGQFGRKDENAIPRTISQELPLSGHIWGTEKCCLANSFHTGINVATLYHQRLGHTSLKSPKLHKRLCDVLGESYKSTSKLVSHCEGCVYSKATHLPYARKSRSVAEGPLEKVFFDVIGPIPTAGKGGYRYVLTLVDEFTGMYFVRLIRRKLEVQDKTMKFKKQQEKHWKRHFGEAILSPSLVKFCSDGGGENTSNTLAKWLNDENIKHDIAILPERHHQLSASRTILQGCSFFWIFSQTKTRFPDYLCSLSSSIFILQLQKIELPHQISECFW